MAKEKDSRVREYYDKNTQRFLKFGHGKTQFSIHRAVWGPGAASREQAFHYVHDLLLEYIRKLIPRRVIDLGCGVGGSMMYLAEKSESCFIGITISRIQKDIGTSLIRRKKLSNRCSILCRDFSDPSFIQEIDRISAEGPSLSFCIESFVHAENSGLFFHNLSTLLRSGDVCVICDDFLIQPIKDIHQRRGKKLLREFTKGWRIGTLMDIPSVSKLGAENGFDLMEDMNLTQYLELNRPRDIWIRIFIFLLNFIPFLKVKNRSPWLDNLIGGNALQRSIQRGLVEYHFLVFKRQ